MDTEPDLTIRWVATQRYCTVNGGQRTDVIHHAVRGRHTLCGRTASTLIHTSPPDNSCTPRCALCAAVPTHHLTAHDLVALGPTHRQINYWCRQGWLTPDNPWCGSGYTMTFPPECANTVSSVHRLINAGITVSAAFRAIENNGELAPGITIAYS